jgi:hypothetical protein
MLVTTQRPSDQAGIMVPSGISGSMVPYWLVAGPEDF